MIGGQDMHPWTLYALEVARDREREARNRRLVNEAQAEQPSSTDRVRRSAALVLAAVSRRSAAAVRRLDDCVAEDLGRSLAVTE
jgi:hypothetical protein